MREKLNFDIMNNEDRLFNKAIEKGELVQFLGGYPGYYLQPSAADLPTEYDDAFFPIKTRIKDSLDLQIKVLEAIKTLSLDAEYGWGAIFYLGNLALMRKYDGFDILGSDFVESVAANLRHNKDAFKSLKKWVGKELEDGVWDMVRVINRNLHNDYGITVLPEEL
jgi:hypothetical protein